MNPNLEFNWETALQTADDLVFRETDKHLTDIEITVLRGAWHGLTYEQIAKIESYATGYISRDVGKELWDKISTALGEKVSKKNFKAALQRESQKYIQATPTHNQERKERSSIENLTFPGGSVALNSPFYLERSPVELICFETIVKPGSLIRIKAVKWMGKTSLVNRILEQARWQSQQTVYLDFGSVERAILQDLDKLLRWLCAVVSRQLRLENKIQHAWDTDILGSNDNCTFYFEEYILAEITSDIVLAFDNVDRLFVYEDVIEDFFGLLRSWHEKGKIMHYGWVKLKLILAHSTEVYIPLDINQSPFNAGVPILLEEFNYEQVKTLASLYQLNWNKFEIDCLMDLVGGHPYLVRLAMYQIKTQNLSLEQFLSAAISETGIYSNTLRRLSNILNHSPSLSSAFVAILESDVPITLDSLQIYQLHSLGLVKLQGNLVFPGCKLYHNYFTQQSKIN
jgi:hypothetical protein